MSVYKAVMLLCDGDNGTCGAESEARFTETEARKVARAAGWKVGRNRDGLDFCPFHSTHAHIEGAPA